MAGIRVQLCAAIRHTRIAAIGPSAMTSVSKWPTAAELGRAMLTEPLVREFVWVRPELVAQIQLVQWTAEGRLRHASFLGLRSDKPASAVLREL